MLTSGGYRGWRREVRVFAGECGRGKGVHLETWVTRADCKGINTDTHTHTTATVQMTDPRVVGKY